MRIPINLRPYSMKTTFSCFDDPVESYESGYASILLQLQAHRFFPIYSFRGFR